MSKILIKTWHSPRQFGLVKIFEYEGTSHEAICFNALYEDFVTFEIDNHQISQLLVWMKGEYLIQEMCPSLTAEQREMCISGMRSTS